MSLMRTFFLALSRSERLRATAVGFAPVRALSRRFVAGEGLEEAIATVQALNQQGLLATLDHLGENVTSETEARDTTLEALDLLEAMETSGIRSGVSIKLTQLGLDISPALAAENAEQIVMRAAQTGRFVRIDMESSEYVPVTLDLFEGLRGRFGNVGVVIQSYLRRSGDDVARLIERGASVRLVKGAYDEPEDVAYARKAETDASYTRLMEQLLGQQAQEKRVFLAIATHDTMLINRAKDLVRQRDISSGRFEFQMLYGIRPALQRQLVAEGYRVRIYVPYGQQWYPYFMRRLAERPANIAFLLRNLLRG